MSEDITKRIEQVEKKVDKLQKSLDELNAKLSKHIEFIDKTYEGLRNPINAAKRFLEDNMGTKKVSTPQYIKQKLRKIQHKRVVFQFASGLLESLGWTEEDELEWYKTHEGHWVLRKVLLAEEPKRSSRGERIKEENLSDTVKEIIKKD